MSVRTLTRLSGQGSLSGMTKEEQREFDRLRVAKRRELEKLPSAPIEPQADEKLEHGKGLIIHPDKLKGSHEPEYYQTVCIYCGSPKTTLVKRNGFLGHLCESHNPNILPKPDSL